MQFGQKKKDAPEPAGGSYLRTFKKGETKVRFIEEPDEWNVYFEHFTPDRKSFPCTEDETCPGCSSENETVAKRSRKYATQVLLVKNNIVLPFKIPVTLSDRLSVRAERNSGTLLNRDYVVLKSGDGFDTEYDVDQEDKYPVNLEELRKKVTIEIQECHKAAYNEVWGHASSQSETKAEKVEQPEVPPTEPGEENVELSMEQIRAMDKTKLQELCNKGGVVYDDMDTKGELIEKLTTAFAV